MNQGETVRRRAVVSGVVQGVFFRASVREWAEQHGVSGWVSNRRDGALEIVLEGGGEEVQAVLRAVEQGPPQARVEGLDVTAEHPTGIEGFEIR